MFPELKHGDIFTIIKSFFAEIFIGEHAGNIKQSGFWAIKKSKKSIAEDVLKTRTPRFAEHTF